MPEKATHTGQEKAVDPDKPFVDAKPLTTADLQSKPQRDGIVLSQQRYGGLRRRFRSRRGDVSVHQILVLVVLVLIIVVLWRVVFG